MNGNNNLERNRREAFVEIASNCKNAYINEVQGKVVLVKFAEMTGELWNFVLLDARNFYKYDSFGSYLENILNTRQYNCPVPNRFILIEPFRGLFKNYFAKQSLLAGKPEPEVRPDWVVDIMFGERLFKDITTSNDRVKILRGRLMVFMMEYKEFLKKENSDILLKDDLVKYL